MFYLVGLVCNGPEGLDDWVGESNPVRAVDVFVDALELRDLRFDGVNPAATGRPRIILRRCSSFTSTAISTDSNRAGGWSVRLCTATVSLQAAGHSLSHRREEVAAVVISGTKRHTPESVVPMPTFGGAYSDVDPLCQLRHLGLRQQRRRRSPARSGGDRNQRSNDRRLMAAPGAKLSSVEIAWHLRLGSLTATA